MSEVFIIATPHKNGAMPKPEKAFRDLMLFSLEDAEPYLLGAQTLFPSLRIFRCEIEVVAEVK